MESPPTGEFFSTEISPGQNESEKPSLTYSKQFPLPASPSMSTKLEEEIQKLRKLLSRPELQYSPISFSLRTPNSASIENGQESVIPSTESLTNDCLSSPRRRPLAHHAKRSSDTQMSSVMLPVSYLRELESGLSHFVSKMRLRREESRVALNIARQEAVYSAAQLSRHKTTEATLRRIMDECFSDLEALAARVDDMEKRLAEFEPDLSPTSWEDVMKQGLQVDLRHWRFDCDEVARKFQSQCEVQKDGSTSLTEQDRRKSTSPAGDVSIASRVNEAAASNGEMAEWEVVDDVTTDS